MLIKAADRKIVPSSHAGISKEVILGSGILVNTTQVAVATLQTGESTELHRHPTMFEVYFVLRGEATYVVGDAEWQVSPGDLVIVPADTLHRLSVTRGPHEILYWGLETGPRPEPA